MEEKINLASVPFDMELAKKITKGDIPGEFNIITSYMNRPCRIVCTDVKGPYPIIALWTRESDNREMIEQFYGNGKNEHNCVLTLRIPELLTHKEGDIITCENHNGNCQWVSIAKEIWQSSPLGMEEHVVYCLKGSDQGELVFNSYSDNIGHTRKATEEEKQQLIEALQEDNSEEGKKILKQFFDIEEDENVTESKQESECKFQSFDKVLVRDSQQGEWRIEFFGFIVDDEFKYRCLYDSYKYCISYNENTKHLLGTTDNWEEEQ